MLEPLPKTDFLRSPIVRSALESAKPADLAKRVQRIRELMAEIPAGTEGRVAVWREPATSNAKVLCLTGKQWSVGRSPKNDIVITDPRISRHHLIVGCSDGELSIRVLPGASETLLNGKAEQIQRISKSALIEMGSSLLLLVNF